MTLPLCDKDNFPHVFAGTRLITYTICFPFQTWIAFYTLLHIKREVNNKMLGGFCLMHQFGIFFFNIVNIMNILPAAYWRWQLYPMYCNIYPACTWSLIVLYNLAGVIFWYQRLELTFHGSVLRAPKYLGKFVYAICTAEALCGLTFAILMSAHSDCVDKVISWDFMPFKPMYACSGWDPNYELVYVFVGIVGVCGLNLMLSYMYVTRLKKLVDQHFLDDSRYSQERSNQSRSGSITCKEDPPSASPKMTNAMYRACLIGATNSLCTLTLYVCTIFFRTGTYAFIPLDSLISSILVMCAFKFGDFTFRIIFGRCANIRYCRKKVVKETKTQTTFSLEMQQPNTQPVSLERKQKQST